MNTQYKKGVLELCVLSLLHKRDCYGYEISDFLSQHIDIADGTVYPILLMVCATHLLNDMMQSVIPAVYPLLKEKFGFTFAQIGLITLVSN
jgi:hypothetical protein